MSPIIEGAMRKPQAKADGCQADENDDPDPEPNSELPRCDRTREHCERDESDHNPEKIGIALNNFAFIRDLLHSFLHVLS